MYYTISCHMPPQNCSIYFKISKLSCISQKISMKLYLLMILALKLLDQGSTELFKCQPSSKQRGYVFFPNIPDFYFSHQNAAAISAGINANLTALRGSTTYFFTIPPRDCSGTFTALQYCYQRNTTQEQGAIYSYNFVTRNGLSFTTTRTILVSPSALGRDCTTLSAELQICCEIEQLESSQQISIPPTQFSFGLVFRNMQFLSFADSATAFHVERAEAGVVIIAQLSGSFIITVDERSILTDRSMALFRFLMESNESFTSPISQPESAASLTTLTTRPLVIATSTSQSGDINSTAHFSSTDETLAPSEDTVELDLGWIIGATAAAIVITLLTTVVLILVIIRCKKKAKPTQRSTHQQELLNLQTGGISTSDNVAYNTAHTFVKICAKDNVAYNKAHVAGRIDTKDNISYDNATGKLRLKENVAYLKTGTIYTQENVAYSAKYVAAESIFVRENECYGAGTASSMDDFQPYTTPQVGRASKVPQQLTYDYIVPKL